MKKFFSAILFLAAMTATVFSLTACGDDEIDEATDGGGNIVGTWKYDMDEDVMNLDYIEIAEDYVQFRKDGSFIFVGYAKYTDDFDNPEEYDYEEGRYTLDGDRINITHEDGERETYKYKVSGKTLSLTSVSGIIITTTLTRVKDSAIDKLVKAAKANE